MAGSELSFLMKKLLINFLIAFLSPLILLSQSKTFTCNKIRNGIFYFHPQDAQKKLIVVRKGSIQKEINTQKTDTSFWKVTWQNACSYSLKFIRKSQPLSDEEKSFYTSHISVVKILGIKKEYYIFKGGLDSINNKSALTDTLWFKPN